MADHFEQAKDAILLRTDGNGGPSTRDLLIAMQALADDNDDDLAKLTAIINENHAETRKLASSNLSLIERHLHEDVKMSNDEFADMINGFSKRHDDRDAVVAAIHSELEGVKHNCLEIHARDPRRKGDPPEVDYSGEDEEMGSIRRSWRIVRYVLLAAAAAGVVFWLDVLSHYILGQPN